MCIETLLKMNGYKRAPNPEDRGTACTTFESLCFAKPHSEGLYVVGKYLIANVTPFIVKSERAEIKSFAIPKQGQSFVAWDMNFWNLFDEFLYLTDHEEASLIYPHLRLENKGFFIASILNYLSIRLQKEQGLSRVLGSLSKRFGYEILRKDIADDTARKRITIRSHYAKAFVLFHELAHAEFMHWGENSVREQQFNQTRAMLKRQVDQVSQLFDAEPNRTGWFFDDLRDCEELFKDIKSGELDEHILEEVAADIFAMRLLLNDFFSNQLDKSIQMQVFHTIGYLLEFLNLKAEIDSVWFSSSNLCQKKTSFYARSNSMYVRRLLVPPMLLSQYGAKIFGNAAWYELSSKVYGITNVFNSCLEFLTGYAQRIKHFACSQQNQADLLELLTYELPFYESPVVTPFDFRKFSIECLPVQMLRNIENKTVLSRAISVANYQTTNLIDMQLLSEHRLGNLFEEAHEAQHGDNPHSSIELYEQFIENSLQKNSIDNPYVCDAYARIARVLAETGDPNTCRKYLVKAVGMYGLHISCAGDALDDLSWAHALNDMGNVFGALNKHSIALKYYLASERIRKANRDLYSLQCMQVYLNIALCYVNDTELEDPYTSFAYAFRALAIAYRSLEANDPTFVKICDLLRFLLQNCQDVPNPAQQFDDAQAEMLLAFIQTWSDALTTLLTEDIEENFYFEARNLLIKLSFENGLEIMSRVCQAWCEKSPNLLRKPRLFPIIVGSFSGKILSALNK